MLQKQIDKLLPKVDLGVSKIVDILRFDALLGFEGLRRASSLKVRFPWTMLETFFSIVGATR